MDVNRDGLVTRADFREMADNMGLPRYVAEQAFNRLDRNGDGIVSRGEQAAAFGGYNNGPKAIGYNSGYNSGYNNGGYNNGGYNYGGYNNGGYNSGYNSGYNNNRW